VAVTRWFPRLLAVVALALAPSLVIAAGPAQAVEPVPVDSRITPLDQLWDAVQNPADALNIMIGDLNRNGTYDYEEAGSPASSMPLMGSLLAEIGGTPAQVQSGEKLASRACRTGWGCFGVLGTMVGLAGAAATDDIWGPVVQGLIDPDGGLPEVQYYPVSGGFQCGTNLVFDVPESGTFMNNDVTTITFDMTQYCAPPTEFAADCHKDGQWVHANSPGATTGWPVWAGTYTRSLGWLCPGQDGSWEVRRIHFPSPVGANTNQWDTAFYWGYEPRPVDGDMESLTRCARPDGSVYDVVVTEPVASGLSAVPACEPGDEPVYIETTHVAPDGTRTPQTSQRLATQADADAIFGPSCSNGCSWVVKVDGVPCTVGAGACVDWASDKSSATCWYGPYQLPLGQCYWMERAYEHTAEPIPGTVPNTDGDPATWDGPVPQLTPTSNPTPTTTASTTTQPSPTTSTTGNPLPTPTPTGSSNPDPTPTPTPSSQPSPSPSPSPTSAPTPKPSATPSPEGSPIRPECVTTYDLGATQPEALALANSMGAMFDIDTIGGYRPPEGDNYGEHSTGLALDFMTYSDSAKGQALADHLVTNSAALGVRWVIWEQQVWSAERAAEGWRGMADRGSPTQNHMDHVHVLVYDDGATGSASLPCSGDPSGAGASGGCMSNAVSWNPVDWVYWPTRCVLEWAFIPPGGSAFFDSQVDELGGTFRDSPVGQWWGLVSDTGTAVEALDSGGASFSALRAVDEGETYDGGTLAPMAASSSPFLVEAGGVAGFGDGGSMCQGPEVSLGFLGGQGSLPQSIYPFAACEGAMANVAETSRLVITALVVYTIFWTSLRQIGAAFNFSIQAPAAPGYGDDDYGPDKRMKS